ncbi:EamA-like transporter family protein [Alienimonas californiensis]|uniref:EamA-like transporter family protein n=1 Tax=Alienimonas californiensis TaxID=2527989 RepID=A0A517PBQ1_9PLAN|nr:EamA-like transporter family protein [Alienimonas californiensis]
MTIGTLLGLCSALTYTLANAALRDLSRPDDLDWSLWVTFCKAAPVVLTAWTLVGWRTARGLPALPPRSVLPRLMAAGVLAQLGGNLMFQEALGVLGLALTVPVTFTGIILCGAGLGWFVLGEPVGVRQGVSIVLLITATAALSLAAPDAAEAVLRQSLIGAHADPLRVALAVATALGAGCAYGTLGVVIRKTGGEGVGVSGTLAPLSLAGLISLAALLGLRSGAGWQSVNPIAGTPPEAVPSLLIAGAANATAFFCIAAALHRIPVVRSNLLNASQAAMAGVVGVVWFEEPPTGWLALGITLTIAGLALLGLRKPRRRTPRRPPPA